MHKEVPSVLSRWNIALLALVLGSGPLFGGCLGPNGPVPGENSSEGYEGIRVDVVSAREHSVGDA